MFDLVRSRVPSLLTTLAVTLLGSFVFGCDQSIDPEDLCTRGPIITPRPYVDVRISQSVIAVVRRGMPDPPNCPAFVSSYRWSVADTTIATLSAVNDSTVSVIGKAAGTTNLRVDLLNGPVNAGDHHIVVVRVSP